MTRLLTLPVERMNTTMTRLGCRRSSSMWRTRAPLTRGATTKASRLVASERASLVCCSATSTSFASPDRFTGVQAGHHAHDSSASAG